MAALSTLCQLDIIPLINQKGQLHLRLSEGYNMEVVSDDSKSGPVSRRGGVRNGAGRPAAPKSDAVRLIRTILNDSQETFAAKIGCTYNALRVMERENRLPTNNEVLVKLRDLGTHVGIDISVNNENAQEM
jgi:DNA-binding transcriptional regulator YiaG